LVTRFTFKPGGPDPGADAVVTASEGEERPSPARTEVIRAGAVDAELRRKSKTRRAPIDIGWREWVRLPGLCDIPIKAKIDTGAKTSAIHAYRVHETEIEGVPHAAFFLHPVQKREQPEVFCRAPIVARRTIRSSNGALENRIIVRARFALGGRIWPIELSLTNRDEMGYRMLVGRSALKSRVVIHPARSFIQGGQED